MKAKRFFPAIAIAMILSLGACADAVGPTGQNPDVTAVLEADDDRDAVSRPRSSEGDRDFERDREAR